MSKKIFISYRREQPDQSVAEFLHRELKALGHASFLDTTIPVGLRWAGAIQHELASCDVFVILISERSMDRDMVREEVLQVHARNRREGAPQILPVRLAFRGKLPYDIAACLDPLQYAYWANEADNESLARLLHAAIQGATVLPPAASPTSVDSPPTTTHLPPKPSPKAEPRLDVIAMPAGNPFYVQRDIDDFFYDSLRWDQGVATLHAPRQMGKSSLFAHVRARLERDGLRSAFVDLKVLTTEPISDAATAFEGVAQIVADELDLAVDVSSYFKGPGFVAGKLERFLVRAVAPLADRIVLLFDDIDSLFSVQYRDPFFGTLRTVIDRKAFAPSLQKIGFGFALSHDPGLWISNASESPFNLSRQFPVPEFSRAEFDWLHQQHGALLTEAEASQLFSQLGGHPYLTRVALYRLAAGEIRMDEIACCGADNDGIFGDHLRGRLFAVVKAGLGAAFKSILDHGCCTNVLDFERLLAMGLVKGVGHRSAEPRFGLYRDYFLPRLDA